tara:strand:- start:638 stop:1042 length:405 start_codon:yes stop_codon:yes gene_type:complete
MYLFIGLMLLAVGYYVYNLYVTPKINPTYVENNEFSQEGPTKEVELYLFYTDWCPHCKVAKPEWNKLKDEFQERGVNNTTIIFREVDCEKEKKLAEEFGVEGYPTIKLVKDNEVIEYDAKPKYETLTEFLHTTL